jgi:hypothetical protein
VANEKTQMSGTESTDCCRFGKRDELLAVQRPPRPLSGAKATIGGANVPDNGQPIVAGFLF